VSCGFEKHARFFRRPLAPPRWSTPRRRYRRTWSSTDSTLGSWIGCGRLISPMRTGQCWLYLGAVRDGCSRRVIGWTIDEPIHADLVESALAMAVAMRGELELGRFARTHNPTRSVGRVGVLLRKRWRRIILGNSKSRVLRPIPWAHPHRP
jgi:transposase InsO family protein